MSLRDAAMRFGFAALPETALRRVLRDGPPFEGVELHPPVAVPVTDVRLFIGPMNSAGQGTRWARAAELLDGVGAASMATDYGSAFRFPVDHTAPHRTYRWSKGWQRAQAAALRRFSHVIVESGERLLGDYFPGSTKRELAVLRRRGVRTALLFHGSDIRHPGRHVEFEPWSPFRDDQALVAELADRVLRNERLVADTGLPVFVSTPDLLDFVPHAVWLPVVADVERWSVVGGEAPLARRVPTVVHVPSNAVIKGTPLVDPILRELDDAGVIRYVRAEGIPSADMPALYGSADIVVDQFRIGNYGVAAVEAMLAGRLVVSHVSTAVRERAHARAGRDLPIVEATPDTLADVIRQVIAAPDEYRKIAEHGVAFARLLHDGHASAESLQAFLLG